MSVICKICGKEFTTITHHVKVKHGIHIDEYREMYPGEETSDKEFLDKRNEKIRETCSTAEFSQLMSKISHEYNGSEEGRELLSDRMKRQLKDPLFRKKGQEVQRKKFEEDLEYREYIIKVRSKNAKSQWESNYDEMSRKVGPHKWVSECTGGTYRSYAEMSLAEQLTYSEVEFEYEPRSFEYYCSNKMRTRKYYPDFYINELNLFVEVKYNEDDISTTVVEKLQAVKDRGYEIIVVYHDEIVKSPSLVTFILNDDLSKFIERTQSYLVQRLSKA